MSNFKTISCEEFAERVRETQKYLRFAETFYDSDADKTTQGFMEQAFRMDYYNPRVRAGLAGHAIMNAAKDGRDVTFLIHILDGYCAAHGLGVKEENAGQENN